MVFHEFPKMAYKLGANPVTVDSAEEFAALGEGWGEKPVSVPIEDQTKILGLNTPTPLVADATEEMGADPKLGADPVFGLRKSFPKWFYKGSSAKLMESQADVDALKGVWQELPTLEAVIEDAEVEEHLAKTSGDGLDAGDWTQAGDGTDYPGKGVK